MPITDESVFPNGLPVFDDSAEFCFMGIVSLHNIKERHDGRKTLVFKLTGDYQVIPK